MSQYLRLPEDTDSLLAPKIAAWRDSYERERYFEKASSAEIYARLNAIFLNIVEPTSSDKLAFLHPDDDKDEWYKSMFDCGVELALRDQPIPCVHLKGWPSLSRVQENFPEGLPDASGCLVRFGSKKRVTEFMEGSIRLAAASEYDSSVLPTAIRDNELAIEERFRNGGISIALETQAGTFDAVAKLHTATFGTHSKSDYFMVSFTNSPRARYFDDFGYDAFAVIRDISEFKKRVMHEVAREHGLVGRLFEVQYYDPFRHSKRVWEIQNISACKDIAYKYQQEYRFVWWPLAPTKRLKALVVNVGAIDDIAECFGLN